MKKVGATLAAGWRKKKTLDWSKRQNELEEILEKNKSKSGCFDCIIPVSGGKDGSYVSYNLKNKFGVNPLTVTVSPPLPIELGDKNLKNFIDSGYNHIQISPANDVMRVLNRKGFVLKGFPYFGWLIAIQSAIIRLASNLNISLIFYGEDGEVEYGGSTESKNKAMYDISYMKRIYLEGGHNEVLDSSGFSDSELYFFLFPTDRELEGKDLSILHWSYFESWDPYRNYLIAKEHCGLQEAEENNKEWTK